MDILESLMWSHQKLSELKVPHALIGGMALSEYGYSRGTQDVDWLIPEEFASIVLDLFLKNSFKIYHQSSEVLQFTGIAEVDFLIARRPVSRSMIENSHYSTHLNLPVVLPEDLIGLKIQAYSGNEKRKFKDLADIQELVINCQSLDWDKIKSYADYFNEWPTLQQMRDSK